MNYSKCVLILMVCSSLASCTKQINPILILPQQKVVKLASFTACDDTNQILELDSRQPLSVFVHGCNFSGAVEFRAMAKVFEFHGQQTLCFNYDDRESMVQSSAELLKSLNRLYRVSGINKITVIGHSQGGLVARKALTNERGDGLKLEDKADYRLITISAPFAGIKESEDCGKTYLHVATLGITIGVCRMIAGAKWNEVYPGADFMENPGTLIHNVGTYLKIVTDERNTCYRYNDFGQCIEDDFVFSTEEQYQTKIDSDTRLKNVQVKAGHAEIVGNRDIAPKKLIAILQKNRVLNQTKTEKKMELESLLSLLY